ncbi:Glucosamine-6-phosphate isomerase (Glucosamine-6-phosphate deaminase) (GNPDA) (GlcN6P deaminase) [Basidiobolus ranarum]|uniref:beta-N-acetylhexosaminidase n=1 Tax=Basidiobolus ranarum TaxID=34480 RepID=A0ABR2WN75_9FUNG
MVGVKLLTSISLLATSTMAWVWPMPQQMDVGSDILRLDERLRIDFETPCNSDQTYYGNYVTHCDDYNILRNAVRRYRKLIFNKGEFGNQLDTVSETVFPIPVTSVPSLPPQPRGDYRFINRLFIKVKEDNLRLQLDTDESYTLDVPTEGDAVIEANSVYGALRGLESFSQLVKWHSSTDEHRIPLAPVHITDYPKFAHRGILIDTSRNYLSPRDIKRTLDAMSYNKLNVLHWHMLDSHSFPLKSSVYPELAKGAYNAEWVYDERTVRDIVRYAKERGIRVMPEYDIPGHSYSWGIAMPEIVSCMNRQSDWSDFAAEPPSGNYQVV